MKLYRLCNFDDAPSKDKWFGTRKGAMQAFRDAVREARDNKKARNTIIFYLDEYVIVKHFKPLELVIALLNETGCVETCKTIRWTAIKPKI